MLHSSSAYMVKAWIVFWLMFGCTVSQTNAQALTLKDAVQKALANYGTLKAKANYVRASQALVKASSREYLPDLNISGQQDYGTVSSLNGPVYGYRGLSVGSSGPVLPSQNWNAAFGALYLANINWDFFAFGRAKEKVKLSVSQVTLDASDLEQEKFQHLVRVAAAYLNLLAAQRISRSQQNNLERSQSLQIVVKARVKNGLNPGVDSSLANAEVSNAKIALTQAKDYEQEQVNTLAQLMGINTPHEGFLLDSFFISRVPKGIYDSSKLLQQDHPVLKYYENRIALSDERTRYYQTFNYPTFSLFGVYQGRGSGFSYGYNALNQDAYSHGYWTGIEPTRSNYLLGLGVTWNLTSPLRIQQQVHAQRWISIGLKDEYDLIKQNLTDQLILYDSKIDHAMANYAEAPIQVAAASDAYLQKSVMYKNGLSNIVDITQALFGLNRAETDRDIAYNNVWQALLLKAAASGDFGLFMNEF
ncbi:MAG TPA: TolC family protein [Puia sp.]|nr:TolC family protein [Puia sp.]